MPLNASVARRLSGSASLSCRVYTASDFLDVGQDALGVTGDVDLLVRLANYAIAADDERHPGRRAGLPDRHAQQPANGAIGIGEERNVELDFLCELSMRIDAVGGHSGDDRTGAVEVGRPPAEVACFDRSAGCIVLRVRPNDEQFRSSICIEIDVTVLRFGFYLRQPVAGHQRHSSSPYYQG